MKFVQNVYVMNGGFFGLEQITFLEYNIHKNLRSFVFSQLSGTFDRQ